ncbi:hypothetical protein Dda_5306 [Drechslerella dactyloides]|uniref:Uncharacterized protein n=1 Tax=Drechslerella dactyloides TaxID=74499 RepID=A0AAD6IVV0_DREDA|nr:hypothetical protein Dda_5306 [Drechslerella dactyloides]
MGQQQNQPRRGSTISPGKAKIVDTKYAREPLPNILEIWQAPRVLIDLAPLLLEDSTHPVLIAAL